MTSRQKDDRVSFPGRPGNLVQHTHPRTISLSRGLYLCSVYYSLLTRVQTLTRWMAASRSLLANDFSLVGKLPSEVTFLWPCRTWTHLACHLAHVFGTPFLNHRITSAPWILLWNSWFPNLTTSVNLCLLYIYLIVRCLKHF